MRINQFTGRRLTIGMHDYCRYYALVERLIAEGHRVVMVKPEGVPEDLLSYQGQVSYVDTMAELDTCDFVLSRELPGLNGDDMRMRGIPVLGHTSTATALESDRQLAFDTLLEFCPDLNLPDQRAFTSPDAAIEYLSTCTHDVVLKKHVNSPATDTAGPTMISRASSQHSVAIQRLQGDNSWFVGGYGGVIVEQFIEGVEVCFGGMFSYDGWYGPMYACEELKDAQNSNRSGLLTPEVGTTMLWNVGGDNRATRVMHGLTEVLTRAHTCGMVDLNTLVDAAGNMWAIEFTVRWGRPTMEMQVASAIGDFGYYLYGAATHQLHCADAIRYEGRSVGVTVFDYGIPYNIPESARPFVMPDSTETSFVVPFLALNVGAPNYMTCARDARHFVSVGVGATSDVAQANAYAPLNGFSLYGATWRDDVGATQEGTIDALRSYGII